MEILRQPLTFSYSHALLEDARSNQIVPAKYFTVFQFPRSTGILGFSSGAVRNLLNYGR
jgi:hypothetical protein